MLLLPRLPRNVSCAPRLSRLRWGALVGATLLGGSTGCLLELPARGAPEDAGVEDAGRDASPIERERFTWNFEILGVVVDAQGSLHALDATGSTNSAGRVQFASVVLDAAESKFSPPTEPRSLGNGAFRLDFPDVRPLVGADLVVVRDEASGVGTAELLSADGAWRGLLVVVRSGSEEPVGGEEAPIDFRFVGVGVAGGAPTAAMARGGIGSERLSLDDGRDGEGRPVGFKNLELVSYKHGGFRVSEPDLAWRGIRGDARRLMVALRWNAVSDNPNTGVKATPYPELWFGVQSVNTGPGGTTLDGAWRVQGVTRDASDVWSPANLRLEFDNSPQVVRYTFRDATEEVVEAGHVDTVSEETTPLRGLISLTPDGESSVPRWFGMAPTDPQHLLLWGTDGHLPEPRLLFGLRER